MIFDDDMLPALYLPQLEDGNVLYDKDIALAGSIFVQIERYDNPRNGDYIVVEWISSIDADNELYQKVAEFQISNTTAFPVVFDFGANYNISVGEHKIRYSVTDYASNKTNSPEVAVNIKQGGGDNLYPAPVFEGAEKEIIYEDYIDENNGIKIDIHPYDGIEKDDLVTLYLKSISKDGQETDIYIDNQNVDENSLNSGLEFFISKSSATFFTEGVIRAYYDVKKNGIRAGLSASAMVSITYNENSNELKLIMTEGAAITDEVIMVKPFNQGVVKGRPGASVTLTLSEGSAVFASNDNTEVVSVLPENGLFYFKVRSTSTGGCQITAQYTDDLSTSITKQTYFADYVRGEGDLYFVNYTNGAYADGKMPCSFYLKTAESDVITKVRVSVNGSATISGYKGKQADVILNSDKSAEIDITNLISETVNVELSLPESSGSFNSFKIEYIDF